MEFIEKYFIIFAALLVVAGLALIVLYAKRDLILHKRKAITYENYQEYKKYFTFQPDNVLLILGAVYLAVLIVMCFLILRQIRAHIRRWYKIFSKMPTIEKRNPQAY